MNDVNYENRISTGKMGIILLRVIYIILFLLSIILLTSETYVGAVVTGVFGLVVICTNIFMKSYIKKMENQLNEKIKKQNIEFYKKRNEIMEERQKIAEEFNKNNMVEIDETKIVLSYADKKRIEKNCKIMKKKGLPYNSEMKLIPFDAIVKVKSKEDIAREMVKEFIIAHEAVNKIEGISDMQDGEFVTNILKYQPDQKILGMLSKISKGEVDNISLNELAYLHERVNVYMWVLGLNDKPLANKVCYAPWITMIIYKYKNMEDLINNCNMKTYEEIMEYADLITRYEWAMIKLNQTGTNSKHINVDSVQEQKEAMDWIVSFNSDSLLKINGKE